MEFKFRYTLFVGFFQKLGRVYPNTYVLQLQLCLLYGTTIKQDLFP